MNLDDEPPKFRKPAEPYDRRMADYAAVHGFNIIYLYVSRIDQRKHPPSDIKWLTWGGFINWNQWFENKITMSAPDEK